MLLVKQDNSEEEDGVVEISPDGIFVRYDDVLGIGAFKVAYKGFDKENSISVAWYQISIDDNALESPGLDESLSSAAALLESLEHDSIIKYRCLWVDRVNNNINVITELFSSRNLSHYRKNHKHVDIKSVKNWGRQILEGLQYLHSQDPPVIHKELRCDNIFVNGNGNGNDGEVKIGDLGLAAIINKATGKAVLGSPEYMAPELYDDDEYNELVDIYSFGMCILELITCECPYRECKNQTHIFKEVTTGVKPLALGKVKVPEIKDLIERCLAPASQRLSAAELSKHSFFLANKSKELKCQCTEHHFLGRPESASIPKPNSQACMSFAPSHQKVSDDTFPGSMKKRNPASTSTSSSLSTEEIEISLKGMIIDSKSISFDLRISYSGVLPADSFEFSFDLDADDALQIAVELVRGKNLSVRHLPLAVELMDKMLLELVPGWKPCY